jgi:hypothetical protein
MFNVGDDYILINSTQYGKACWTGKIVNTYEEEPGIWIVIVREPQTGTLLKRRRTVKKSFPLTTNGGF